MMINFLSTESLYFYVAGQNYCAVLGYGPALLDALLALAVDVSGKE